MPRDRSRSPRRHSGRNRSRSRSRSRERRDRRRERRRSRSPVHRSSRRKSRSPVHKRSRSRSQEVVILSSSIPAIKSRTHENASSSSNSANKLEVTPQISDADFEGKSNDEIEMMKLMGFSDFNSTKGKHVNGTDVSAVHLIQKRKYRQYMNRKGGFNRPLDFVAWRKLRIFIMANYAQMQTLFSVSTSSLD